jgi:hypothetical protein
MFLPALAAEAESGIKITIRQTGCKGVDELAYFIFSESGTKSDCAVYKNEAL